MYNDTWSEKHMLYIDITAIFTVWVDGKLFATLPKTRLADGSDVHVGVGSRRTTMSDFFQKLATRLTDGSDADAGVGSRQTTMSDFY